MSKNALATDNQQGSSSHVNPSETTRRAPFYKAYMLAVIRDGTYNVRHKSWRISQKHVGWLFFLKKLLKILGYRSWIYREGMHRSVWVLETTAKFLSNDFDPLRKLSSRGERIAFVRGYFDAEGGIPHSIYARFYIQLVQKNFQDLNRVKLLLEGLRIQCGKVHNPSKRKDPEYWRFYINRESHFDFMKIISSWHPFKRKILQERMKI